MKEKLIFKNSAKTKCDVRCCKNAADYFIPSKNVSGRFYLCSECLERVFSSADRPAPKSPQNAIKRLSEKKERENETRQ